MKTLAFTLIVSLGGVVTVGPSTGFAKCQNEEIEKKDRAIFERQLRLIKDRVAGYEEFVQEKHEMETQRQKGVGEVKKKREHASQNVEEAARQFHGVRVKDLRARREAAVKAWKEHARKEQEFKQQLTCAREAYLRARGEFETAKDRIQQSTEELELDVRSR